MLTLSPLHHKQPLHKVTSYMLGFGQHRTGPVVDVLGPLMRKKLGHNRTTFVESCPLSDGI